jgi:arginine N-succinyltransferase
MKHVIRQAGLDDLAALLELAVLSGPGFTTLPVDEATLRDRLALSQVSFAGEVASSDAWYTLMIEDVATGRVDGVAGVRAAVGLKRPHFSFRVMTLAQISSSTSTRFDHQVLMLVNECAGWTEVGSLFLRPEARATGAGTLLARSRYMLIGAEPTRFAATVMAELRGWVEPDARCPFWDGVASKFFRLPFVEADRMIMSTDGQFVLDLAPRHPIYVELIDAAASAAIGRCHRDGEAALAMLEREGFVRSGLVDIFDAGPTVTCPRDRIATIAGSRRLTVRVQAGGVHGPDGLISTPAAQGFRAVRAPVIIDDKEVVLGVDAVNVLGVEEGDMVQVRT